MRAARARIGLAAMLVLAACSAEPTPSPRPACPTEPPTAVSAQATLQDATLATVTVSGAVEGQFAFELYGDQAPIATANFVALARCGFYDGIWFHRILAGFVIQAGDPGHEDPRRAVPGDGERRRRLRVRDRAAGGRARLRSVRGRDGEQHPDERQPVLRDPGRSVRPAGARCTRSSARSWTGRTSSTRSPRCPWRIARGSRSSSSRSNPSRFRADPSRFRQAIEARIGRKALCNVKETKPRKALSKRNR